MTFADSPLPAVEVPVETGVLAAPFDITMPPDGCQKLMTEAFFLLPAILLPGAHFPTVKLEGSVHTPENLPDVAVLTAPVATTSGKPAWHHGGGGNTVESFCSL